MLEKRPPVFITTTNPVILRHMQGDIAITSLANPRVKETVKLRQRSHRDESGLMLAEGFRDLLRAVKSGWKPRAVFFCEDLFLKGENEPGLLDACRKAGAELVACTQPVFEKMAYRERPDGLLAVGPQIRHTLDSLTLSPTPLVIVAEAVEKPGNLGTLLRSADGAGAEAVIVCDRCTDICNPNVVRASTGMVFTMPVVEAGREDVLAFLNRHHFAILAATPHAAGTLWQADMRGPTAILVGTEQYGLSEFWLNAATLRVRIPMLGRADSLNVATAGTILLFEAVRQRHDPADDTPPHGHGMLPPHDHER